MIPTPVPALAKGGRLLEREMDHELREKCTDLMARIKHLQDSL